MAPPSPFTRPPLRRVIHPILSILLGILVALAGLEGGLRLTHVVAPGGVETGRSAWHALTDDPVLGYLNRPQGGEDPICHDGFRGPCVPPFRWPGVDRVAVVGDSVAFGQGVRGEEAFPAVLQRLLGESHPSGVEVINAAVPAYDLTRATATYGRRLRPYRPDLVLYAFFTNDFEEQNVWVAPGNPPQVVMVTPETLRLPRLPGLPPKAAGLLWERSWLARWLGLAWAQRHPEPAEGLSPSLLEKARQHLVALRDGTEADGAGLLVVLLPPVAVRQNGSCGDPKIPPHSIPGGFCSEARASLREARSLCLSSNIPIVDLSNLWPEDGPSFALTPEDLGHPNQEGHALIAASLVEEVGQRLEKKSQP